MYQLSYVKEIQEREVVETFAQGLGRHYPELAISSDGIEDLPERDHDFLIHTQQDAILVQVTEIREQDFTFPLSTDEYNSGQYSSFLLKESGSIPWAIDEDRLETCILRAIENKLSKYYARPENQKLWLLIFSTSHLVQTVYYEAGTRRESKALAIARDHLASATNNPFDNIWYSNLLTRPIRIWPTIREDPGASKSERG